MISNDNNCFTLYKTVFSWNSKSPFVKSVVERAMEWLLHDIQHEITYNMKWWLSCQIFGSCVHFLLFEHQSVLSCLFVFSTVCPSFGWYVFTCFFIFVLWLKPTALYFVPLRNDWLVPQNACCTVCLSWCYLFILQAGCGMDWKSCNAIIFFCILFAGRLFCVWPQALCVMVSQVFGVVWGITVRDVLMISVMVFYNIPYQVCHTSLHRLVLI